MWYSFLFWSSITRRQPERRVPGAMRPVGTFSQRSLQRAFLLTSLLGLAALPAHAHPTDTSHIEFEGFGAQVCMFLAMGLPALLVGIAIYYHCCRLALLSASNKNRGEKN
ncbi:MAG: hypothetical protein JWL77_4982 [Chthonomonadaceae bacterium]|nr:hypothetical protein [Chthonomonadaceae bacterium]